MNGAFGSGNILPESPAINDIALLPGSGVFSGKKISGLVPTAPFNNLRFRSVDSLASHSVGSPENLLHVSSGGRWAGSMGNSTIGLQLLSIDPGLTIHNAMGGLVFNSVGEVLNLGSGSLIDFTPIFAVDESTPTGQNFNAVFKLIDTGTGNGGSPWLEGGQFVMQVTTAVPEPSSAALLGLMLGTCVWQRRARRTAG